MKAGRRFSRPTPIALLLAVLAQFVLAAPAWSATPPAPHCRMVSLPVSAASGRPPALTMVGELCLPNGATPTAVQLLVHGITYDHNYWNSPVDPETTSYVRYATAAGYATFAPDRIGYGGSTHPPGASLTLESAAWQMHLAIQALRTGTFGVEFTSVAYVGHSLGSVIAWYEAGYHDVDSFVISDALHDVNLEAVPGIPGQMTWPAALDSRLGPETHYDPLYLTTAPGARGRLFYNAANADPAMIAWDEANKQANGALELSEAVVALYGTGSLDIRVPTMVAMGQDDQLFCGALGADCGTADTLRAHEAGYYANAPLLSSFVLPGVGHDINLHRDSPVWFAAAQQFLRQTMP